MPRIGVTGHMNLSPDTVELVAAAIKELLAAYPPSELTGVSCIAAGADSIFAEAVVDAGGRLEVVLPAADYRERRVKPNHAPTFDRLIVHAAEVRVMPHLESNRAAYEAANEAMLHSCELLVAVWDGQPAVDRGGTAAVVDQAAARGLTIQVVWPQGAQRA
ncbi:hypothetical protein AB0B31_10605 [Catellatospora citrea]|uniref:hypothetical protein n=1 Tax=Catellatospora citrea TaxID=53366 RepID=UPI0033FE16E2